MRITRRFHPVGQGAFYSEVINVDKKMFCAVYDCGTLTRGNSLSHSIQNSGLPEEIDILFISHFDKDHISGVEELLRNHKVKNIFIPFLSKTQELYFRILFKVISIRTSVSIYFIEADEDAKEENSGDEDVREESDIKYQIISISQSIKICSKIITYWKYNLFYSEGENSQKKSVNTDIKSLEDYFKIEKIETEKDLKNKPPKELERLLKECNGKIGQDRRNRYCLCVLSTPININTRWGFCCINSWRNYCNFIKYPRQERSPSCLYLGDSSLKDQKNRKNLIEKLLSDHKDKLDLIETIQVPHHGSDKNHNTNFYKKLHNLKFAVCSFGLGNGHKHPSVQVVKDIVIQGYCFISVTQSPCSEYIQVYEQL